MILSKKRLFNNSRKEIRMSAKQDERTEDRDFPFLGGICQQEGEGKFSVGETGGEPWLRPSTIDLLV